MSDDQKKSEGREKKTFDLKSMAGEVSKTAVAAVDKTKELAATQIAIHKKQETISLEKPLKMIPILNRQRTSIMLSSKELVHGLPIRRCSLISINGKKYIIRQNRNIKTLLFSQNMNYQTNSKIIFESGQPPICSPL
jgi:hypothetical protein